jgi:hypothetical protein
MSILKNIFKGLFEEDFESLNRQLEAQKSLLQQAQSTNLDLKTNTSNLQSQVARLCKEKDDSIARQKVLIGQIDSLTKQVNSLTKQVDIERGKKDKNWKLLTDEKKAHEADVANNQASIESMNHQFSACKSALESEINQLKAELDSAQQEVKSKDTNCELLAQEVSAAHAQIAELRTAANASLVANDVLQETNKSLQDKVKQADETITDLRKQVADVHEQLMAKDVAVASVQEALQKQIEAKSEECNALQERVNSLSKITENEEILDALRQDNEQKKREITRLESEVQALNEKISDHVRNYEDVKAELTDKNHEIHNLRLSLEELARKSVLSSQNEQALREAQVKIQELQTQLDHSPKISDIESKVKAIIRLQAKNDRLKQRLAEQNMQQPNNQEDNRQKEDNPTNSQQIGSTETATFATDKQIDPTKEPSKEETSIVTIHQTKSVQVQTPASLHPQRRKAPLPYSRVLKAPSETVLTKEFPKIENENRYYIVSRMIDVVYDNHTNQRRNANDIFNQLTVDEIAKLSTELEEAARVNKPYLVCPYCGNMVKISSRRFGWGDSMREVQFFSHAVKYANCVLQKDHAYNISVDGFETGSVDDTIPRLFKELIRDALMSAKSQFKGVSDIKMEEYVYSTELSVMKARRPDISAQYKGRHLVFELVSPNTNTNKVHDRDIFYLINNIQVVWVFGLETSTNYDKLMSSVAKNILFTSRRNVFVFDLEAQNATRNQGELVLKCNWLDENGEWYYQIKKNGRNGVLVTIDKLLFDDEECRPYIFDADAAYFEAHPDAVRPAKLDKESLKKELEETWRYEVKKREAVAAMVKTGSSIQMYQEDGKWGFKYGDVVFIEPTYFHEPTVIANFAKVQLDTKYGVVDCFGSLILAVKYDAVEILQTGHIVYSDGQFWRVFGILDTLANTNKGDTMEIDTLSTRTKICHVSIIKSLYSGQPKEEFYFLDGKIFKKNTNTSKWSIWFMSGDKAPNTIWDQIEFLPDETIKVQFEGTIQILSLEGNILKEEETFRKQTPLENGYSLVESYNGTWGLTDADGKFVVKPMYSELIPISNYLKMKRKGFWGIMSLDGTVLAEPQFTSIDSCDDNIFTVQILNPDKSWERLTGKVTEVGTPISESCRDLENGWAITKRFERLGLEHNGEICIPHIYTVLVSWSSEKFIAQKNDKFGIVNCLNEELLPFKFSSIKAMPNNLAVVKMGTSSFTIDSDLHTVAEEVINLQDGFKKEKIRDKWGIVDANKQVIVDYKYDEITTFRGRLIGIINGHLVKLQAYYPHRLQMNGVKVSASLVKVSTVLFRFLHPIPNVKIGYKVDIALINWLKTDTNPMVDVFTEEMGRKTARHIDKPEDFEVGLTYEAAITHIEYKTVKLGKKLKCLHVSIGDSATSYVYLSHLSESQIDINSISLTTKLRLTKLGYDEFLDRTQWKVEIE